MSVIGLLTGDSTLIVGLGECADGALKVYVGSRGRGVYVVVTDEAEKVRVRRAWAASYNGHLFMATPPREALYLEGVDDYEPGGDA